MLLTETSLFGRKLGSGLSSGVVVLCMIPFFYTYCGPEGVEEFPSNFVILAWLLQFTYFGMQSDPILSLNL
jgi:hypothetical protein